MWGRSVTHYSPVRHSHHQASLMDPVRLACVKHAASVHPEPESNPPQKNEKARQMTRTKTKIDNRPIRKDVRTKTLPPINRPHGPNHKQSGGQQTGNHKT